MACGNVSLFQTH